MDVGCAEYNKGRRQTRDEHYKRATRVHVDREGPAIPSLRSTVFIFLFLRFLILINSRVFQHANKWDNVLVEDRRKELTETSYFSKAPLSTGGPCPSPTITLNPLLGIPSSRRYNHPGPGGYIFPFGGPVTVNVSPSTNIDAVIYTRRMLAWTPCVTYPKSMSATDGVKV